MSTQADLGPEDPEPTNATPEQASDHSSPLPGSDNEPALAERHGCVTAWLVFMIIANAIVALIYMFTADKLMQTSQISLITIVSLIILGALNVVFAIMLLSWKKIGFYGFVITGIIAFLINVSIGISPVRSILGLAGIAILYGILQIKKDDTSAWDYLE